jgi:hypothetical protein
MPYTGHYAEAATTLITEVEEKIQGLIREAADAAEYDAISDLAAAAKGLAAIRIQLENPSSRESSAASPPVASVYTAAKPKQSYPRFRRDGDMLVKIGWSKSGRSEYEHKAPRAVVGILIDAIAETKTKRFSTEALFPLRANDGAAIPDYQSYLCLAWLGDIGAVERDGRQGYRLQKKALRPLVDSSWERLTAR